MAEADAAVYVGRRILDVKLVGAASPLPCPILLIFSSVLVVYEENVQLNTVGNEIVTV